MEREAGLDQTSHACGRIEMADVRFHRPDAGEIVFRGLSAIGIGQRGNLDRVAQISAGAVAFDKLDLLCRDT